MPKRVAIMAALFGLAAIQPAGGVEFPAYQSLELHLAGKSVPLDARVGRRIALAVRDMMGRCGFNSVQHAGNFGSGRPSPVQRWSEVLAGPHLYLRYTAPFQSRSGLGETLPVTEVLIAFEHADYIGPEFSRHGDLVAEHIRCGDQFALELMCMAELAPYLPASYRRNCAHLRFGADGRPLDLPPDIAPSCS